MFAETGIEWITIDSGFYTVGEDPQYVAALAGRYRSQTFMLEIPRQKVFVEGFKISKYPITNRQFWQFTQATGHKSAFIIGYTTDKDYMRLAAHPDPTADRYPARFLSARDATAFCAWAGCRLPTEIEWMVAAGGAEGLRYPWGNVWDSSRCNTRENATSGEAPIIFSSARPFTTAVDAFPTGASPFGAIDMAGNVWEITSDTTPVDFTSHVYRQYTDDTSNAYHPIQASYDTPNTFGECEYVILKGGSCLDNRLAMRCGARLLKHTLDSLGDFVGFRCAQSL